MNKKEINNFKLENPNNAVELVISGIDASHYPIALDSSFVINQSMADELAHILNVNREMLPAIVGQLITVDLTLNTSLESLSELIGERISYRKDFFRGAQAMSMIIQKGHIR